MLIFIPTSFRKTNKFTPEQILLAGGGLRYGQAERDSHVNPISKTILCLLVVLAPLSGARTADLPHPNVLVIFTDDHGQWAVGSYGNEDVHTPHMDRLAAEGMRFTRGFTKPVCSPSRAMLLTGLYSHRVGIPDFIPHGNPIVSGNGLPAGTPTAASVLKKAGYDTALVGKWHLGYGETYFPERFGFDVAEGYRYIAPGKEIDSVGKIPFLVNGDEVDRFRHDSNHTDVLADRAIEFLQRDRENRPFFLFLSIYLPHLPWGAVTDEDRAHYEGKVLDVSDVEGDPDRIRELRRDYYANITCADRNIGRVLDTIDDLGLNEDTLVFFIGDNGFNVGQHGLLGKGNARVLDTDGRHPNMFDHSVLVPFLVRWPGVVEAGSVSEAMVATIDVLPTLAEMTGQADAVRTDGRSLLPILRGAKPADWRDAWIDVYDMTYLKKDFMRMIRTDDWKLVTHSTSEHELFDLKSDPEELHNLYSRPDVEKVRRDLEARLEQWTKEVGLE